MDKGQGQQRGLLRRSFNSPGRGFQAYKKKDDLQDFIKSKLSADDEYEAGRYTNSILSLPNRIGFADPKTSENLKKSDAGSEAIFYPHFNK